MSQPGTPEQPLRVAIIGSGPAAFYAAEHLLKQTGLHFSVDMLDRLPTPYGLVRGGVAPDHQKIKSVISAYEKIAAHPNFRFFGNVEFGRDVKRADLEKHFHAILYAVGAQTDRHLGIPGESLMGSHSATEFVAWYNGHPDFRDRRFDLTAESVAIVGVGNVAVDVARILCLTPEELRTTDMADYAIEALSHANVKDIHLLGRRGPVQAAFTTNEARELGELPGADVVIKPEEIALDPLSAAEMEAARVTTRAKFEIVQGLAKLGVTGKPRRLHMRFLVSPVELIGDANRRVKAVKLAHNRLVKSDAGSILCEPNGEEEMLPAGLVFRSVGYRGVPLADVPFRENAGLIPHLKGRVLEKEGGAPLQGHYATGWIKRGPTGVIGNNKADSVETANSLIEDAGAGTVNAAADPSPAGFEALVRSRQPRFVSFADWKKLDALETARGTPLGRPRVKFTSIEEMLAALAGA
jgi:ferredoxin--NADP+ reductase